MDPTSQQASDYIARWQAMQADRQQWMTLWDECARYIMQRKGNVLTKYTPGTAQGREYIYDSTASEAANIGAAGMMTQVMPAGQKWFRFGPPSDNVSDASKDWLQMATDDVTQCLNGSNYYLTAHENCIDSMVFCSALMFEEQGKKKPLNFINIPVGTFAWQEDTEGIIDTIAREWKWTARQAAQKWGKDKLGKAQLETYNTSAPSARNRLFTYLHFVEPREDSGYQGGLVAGMKRPIRSCYICVEDQQIIEEDGYYSMPYFGSRLLRSNNEIYGRGPGLDAMPEIKLVNAMERDILTWTELMANPPWLKPEDSAYQMNNSPGSENVWDASNPNNKPEQVQLKNRVDMAEQKTEQKRERIRRAFFNDLFQMLTNMDEQKREKTAFEVQQMVAEKLLLFSPLFQRYTSENVTPMLARSLDIRIRSGAIPPPPDELQGATYTVDYVSKIALAIKAAENQAFATMMTLVEQASALDPSCRNVVDWQEGVRDVARNVGVKASLINNRRKTDMLTQQQQAAVQEAQRAQNAELATRAVKNLGPEAQTQAARQIVGGAGKAA